VALAAKRAGTGPVVRATEFEAFYSSGFPTVYRAALAFSNSADVASEATQEAFVRAFARWRRLRDEHWALGWVMTTALNIARKLQREGLRKWPRWTHTAQDPAKSVVDRVDLVTELATLPPRQRQALVLHYIGGLQISEIAHLMDVSVGGVKSHLFKARAALRKSNLREERR
jgi:RNA polymerase sigma-70 factor (ECF subfamily)